MRGEEVVVLMGLKPSSHLTVDSRDIVTAQCPTHSPCSLHLEWGFLGFPMETLKKLFDKPPTSIGVVTCGISSHWVGGEKVFPFGASRCGASTKVPFMHLALNSLIIFIEQTRTTFKRVGCGIRNIRTQC